jgi:hypothetical protein
MASMLSHATLEPQPAQELVVHVAPEVAPEQVHPAESEQSVEELDRALTEGLKLLQDGAPKDPSYWLG